MQKLLTFFQQKYWHILDIKVLNLNETLTNDVVSFEQPGPDHLVSFLLRKFLFIPKKRTQSKHVISRTKYKKAIYV